MEERVFHLNGVQFHMTAEFQPIVNLHDQKIERYEALARFKNADGTLASTQDIIDTAEKYGVIDKVTEFIFELICRFISKKKSLKFSFNLSHCLLNDILYPERLNQHCLDNGINPQNIEIEISEKATLEQLTQSGYFLKKAKAFGFSISLDDFGAGNLKIDSLGQFGFDTIKIDRSVIDGIGLSAHKRSVLHAILVEISHLRLNVICEGVEKKADLNLLKTYENIGVQGYIFYRPLTIMQLKLLEGF